MRGDFGEKVSGIVPRICLAAAFVFTAAAMPVSAESQRKGGSKKSAPLPAATFDSVSYGSHAKQCLDVYLPQGAKSPVPAVIYIHGGGFRIGGRKDSGFAAAYPRYKAAGLAVISVEYRYLSEVGDVKPPVKGCIDDVFAAIRLVKSKAKEWNIDINRIGLSGGSAGAHSSLCAALTDDNAFGIRAVFAHRPQTSMDPVEMQSWIPNSRYGHQLFGYRSFAVWKAHRDDCLPWIEKFSPIALLVKSDVAKMPVVICAGRKSPKAGEKEPDPTHGGMFIEKFLDKAKQLGAPCRRGSMKDFIRVLKG